MEIGCAICQESFTADVECDATRCGHVFHKTCFAAWIQHTKTCPTCHAPIQKIQFNRIYFTTNMSDEAIETDKLQRKPSSAGDQEAKLKADLITAGQIQATLQADLAAAAERESQLNSLVEKLQADMTMGRSVETSYERTIVTTFTAQLKPTESGLRILLRGPDLSKVPKELLTVVQQKAVQYFMIDKGAGPIQIHTTCRTKPKPTYASAVATREAQLMKQVAAGEVQLRSEVAKFQEELSTAAQRETQLHSEVAKLKAEVDTVRQREVELMAKLQAEVNLAAQRESQLNTVVAKLKAEKVVKLKNLQEKITIANQRAGGLEVDLLVADQKEAQLQSMVVNLQKQMVEVVGSADRLERLMAIVSQRNNELITLVSSGREIEANLNLKVASLTTEVANLKAEAVRLNGELGKSRGENNQLNGEVAKLNGVVAMRQSVGQPAQQYPGVQMFAATATIFNGMQPSYYNPYHPYPRQ